MEAKRESYYTCQGTEGVRRGIPWLQEQGRNGLIVTIGPDNLDALSSCLAPERIGQLKGGADVELSASLKLSARTERSLGQSWDGSACTGAATRPAMIRNRTPNSADTSSPASRVSRTPKGAYKLDWHAVSNDTHRVQGSYTFKVK